MDPDVELSIEGRLLLNGELVQGCVGIAGGRIVAVKKILEGETHLDLYHHLVVPAAVDMHVHFRTPGDARGGTFASESLAAAFGGVTAVADMPNTDPPAVDVRSWRSKLEEVRGTSHVDYALYMGLRGPEAVRDLGLVSGLFKLYTASTTGELLVREESRWIAALAKTLEAGGRVVVHAEDQDAIDGAEPTGEELERHHTSRPPLGEASAVAKVARVAVSTGVPGHVHVAHVSCAEALRALGGSGVSAEVTPHHLFLDSRREDLGAFGKMNPPLRTDSDRAALWTALAAGRVPVMASDHAPHAREDKSRRFSDAPSGVPGVETMVPMAMAEATHGRISLARLVDAVSVRPAAFLGLAPRGIGEGAEAHLAAYDPKGETGIETDRLHQRCGWTPYEGMPAIFPHLVLSPSGVLVQDGEPQMSRPGGRYVGLTLEQYGEVG